MAAKNKGNYNKQSGKASTTASKPAAKATQAPPELTNTFREGFWKAHWAPMLILTLLAFPLYWATLQFGYVLDDQMVIWDNIYVQKGVDGLREIFAYDSFMGFFKQPQFLLEGGRYRPLSLATFALEISMFGKDHPGISHLINIVLYGLTGAMLYRVLEGLFPLKEGGKWYFGVPFLASVLFVLHPLHSECVANIKGRDEILALMGSLGALYATLKYFDTRKVLWLVVSCISLLLGMLSKENAMTFLVIIPLTVWFFGKVPAGRAIAASWPLLLATFIFIIIRYKALGYMLNHGKSMTDLMNNPFLGMTFGEKYATTFLTLGWYLKLLFVPHPLTHDYYPYHVPKVGWTDWRALLGFALNVGMGIWAVLNIRKRNLIAYLILFYLITLSIVSNLFVSVGTFMNERFVYMPSVAFCVLVAWFFSRKLPEFIKEQPDRVSILGALLFAGIVAIYGLRTYTRIPDWKDALSLNGSAVKTSPNSARSHCFYTTAIYENVYQKIKDKQEKAPWIDTMEYHINRSLQINPQYGSAWIMKGAIVAARFEQDHQMDKLFHEFEIVLDHIPTNANFRKFLDSYIEYLATSGGNPNKIATFCYRVGYERYYKDAKDTKRAIEILELALKTQTEDERVLLSLAEIYERTGRKDKGAEMRQRAEASSLIDPSK